MQWPPSRSFYWRKRVLYFNRPSMRTSSGKCSHLFCTDWLGCDGLWSFSSAQVVSYQKPVFLLCLWVCFLIEAATQETRLDLLVLFLIYGNIILFTLCAFDMFYIAECIRHLFQCLHSFIYNFNCYLHLQWHVLCSLLLRSFKYFRQNACFAICLARVDSTDCNCCYQIVLERCC